MRNPAKVRYLVDKERNKFEAPMKTSVKDVKTLKQNYSDRLEFEKYMNPKGLKPTITSRFKKPAKEIEFVSHELTLMRSPKPYDQNTVCFKHSDYLSKIEVRQYLSKLYKFPINRVASARHQGKIMNNSDRTYWRKKDFKKSIVRLDYEVEADYQKIM
jgi:ribosomal protein L23